MGGGGDGDGVGSRVERGYWVSMLSVELLGFCWIWCSWDRGSLGLHIGVHGRFLRLMCSIDQGSVESRILRQ